MDSKGANQDPAIQAESFPELLDRLVKSSAAMVHDEIDLVIQQIREKGRALRNGVLLVAIAAVFAICGLGSLCAALMIQLTAYMSPAIAALVTGATVILVGIVIAGIGFGKLKKSIHNP